ncbi:MAG: penicillin-binding protein 2 [Candidatus Kapabacteria bacterium]|nr:penicillin-binding protein 2 [Candidatus Kapabacteria bacterium]
MKIFKQNNNILDNSEIRGASKGNFIKILLIIIFSVYFGRVIQLQLFSGQKYRTYSEAQAIKKVKVTPPRGQIFDVNGKMLVHNQALYNLAVIPASFDSTTFIMLNNLITLEPTSIEKVFSLKNSFDKYTPTILKRDIDFSEISVLNEYQQFLPGVTIQVETKRLYEDSVRMPHILGYIRQVSEEQISKAPYLESGDMIGQNGVEKSYEELLKGIDGYQYIAIDRKGKNVYKFNEGKQDQNPVSGTNLYLTIDFELQKYAEELLDGNRGAIVAIDPRNGEIRALVSKPDYDPNIFNGRLSQTEVDYLYNNKDFPLINRAIQGLYPPGSTFKMLIALAALQEGVITQNSTFYCSGSFHYGDRDVKCHAAHGNINVIGAIQNSCNSFFSQLGLKIGMDIFEKYGNMFGFGQFTNIDLPNEKAGLLPTKSWLYKNAGENVSFGGRLVNYGIGQGEILVTPLQMAVYTAAIANKGTIFQPHIVKEIEEIATQRKEVIPYSSKKLNINSVYFDIIQQGMLRVVTSGTGTSAYVPGLKVCGKTGTAQNPGRDHSWFVCFAPMDNPQIAIAIIVENAGWGGAISAPIAQKLLMKYFNIQIQSPKPIDSTATPKITATR